MKASLIILGILLTGGVLYLVFQPSVMNLQAGQINVANQASTTLVAALPTVSSASTSSPLSNPPEVVQAEYFSAWSAGLNRRMDSFISTAKDKKLNAVVIDIKDYSGYVSYEMEVPAVKAAGADKQLRIADIDALVKKLHAANIYVIARVTVFQDPVFAKAHPELALKDKTTGGLWRDRKGLAWLDAGGKPTWDYVIAIARDCYAHGIDEVNFDYVRFPSDGKLDNATYPFWNGTTPKHEVLKEFFKYVRQELPNKKISADLFGLVTVAQDDMGIGQMLEDAYPYFDYVAPMVYPSHFANGSFGYKNPAEHPYDIIKKTMDAALARRIVESSSTPNLAKIRPWLQVFDLGAKYTPPMVADQIRATEDSLATSTDSYGGWLLWDPANTYTSYTP